MTTVDMRSCLVVIFYFCSVTRGVIFNKNLAEKLTYLTIKSPSGGYVNQSLIGPPTVTFQISHSNVKFYFYSKKNKNYGVGAEKYNISHIADFNPSKETIFVVHGWMNNYTTDMPQSVKNAYLATRDVNVFIVDWGAIAKSTYINARYAIGRVGKYLANFIISLVKDNSLKLSKTGIVGHSLGAHVSGVAGLEVRESLNSSLDHIVGLDPAGPLFLITDTKGRLDKGDANSVQVIHTCAGLLGYPFSLGDTDYWPNGGHKSQPGCGVDLTGSCSHGRSYEFYQESLRTGNFVSQKCISYLIYLTGSCNNTSTSLMGEDDIDRKASGSYYLRTNSEPLYAKG